MARSGGGEKGFIKGPTPACCLMDVPFSSLKYVLNRSEKDRAAAKYEPYGVFIQKQYAYKRGCRPVLYLSNSEMEDLAIPESEWWRVVRLEVSSGKWISWLHEREWRCRGDLVLPRYFSGVLVKDLEDVEALHDAIADSPRR